MLDTSITKKGWAKIGARAHHGIDLPLAALHSRHSCGIGEYTDLLPLIDWCAEIGFDVIMLLPLNDSHLDPSPYNALSASALHPIYIGLSSLPFLEKHPDLQKMIQEMQSLNQTARIAYQEVFQKKKAFLRLYFARIGSHFDETIQNFGERYPALKTYALFKTLKEKTGNQSWQEWPQEWRSMTPEAINAAFTAHRDAIYYHLFCQVLAFEQLKQAKDYAESRGVFLKGDIPILISPESADVWQHPYYFDLSFAAGYPPDPYSVDGQYWGFPIYRWDRLAQESFSWWRERLDFAANFYHIYRIDHVIGFFRIWAIPRGHHPKEGHYIPDNHSEVLTQGRLVIENLIDDSEMLPIAEDLGWMPDGAAQYLQEFGICGTRVIRWEKDPSTNQPRPLENYIPLSMTTVSTHDSETLAQWWQIHPEEAGPLAHMLGLPYQSELSAQDRFYLLLKAHQTPSFFHINLIGEYLALFPELVSPHLAEERINVPGTISPHNWTYRIRPSLEELMSHTHLTKQLQQLIQEAKKNGA